MSLVAGDGTVPFRVSVLTVLVNGCLNCCSLVTSFGPQGAYYISFHTLFLFATSFSTSSCADICFNSRDCGLHGTYQHCFRDGSVVFPGSKGIIRFETS